MTTVQTANSTDSTNRIERDLLGDLEAPADAYYGIHSQRAVHNFPISGTPTARHVELVRSMAAVIKRQHLASGPPSPP
jgi:aspartate ammonia-lyase